MQINGVITEPGFKQNKAKTKQVFSFKLTSGDKWQYIYTNNTDLQTVAVSLNNKHVTIEGSESQSGDKTYFNPDSIKESEAPKQASTKVEEPKTTNWDMIGRQKARCSILQAAVSFCNGVGEHDANASDAVRVAEIFEAYVFSPIPSSAPTIAKKAPVYDQVMANKAQLSNLKKYVKAKNDAELLAQACYRCNAELKTLEEIPEDIAMEWLNEVVKK